jgi:hypothetical protein
MNLEKYTQSRRHPVRTFFAVTIPVVLLFIAGQYAVLSMIAVREYIRQLYLQEDVLLLSAKTDPDSETFSLYKDKTWLESRFQLTKSDSISLSVNLKDSVLQLELKGVVLQSSKMIDFRLDELFKHFNMGAYHHYFAEQATGKSVLATIAKEPLIVQKAPRDSMEYASRQHPVDSTKQEAVHWLVNLDNGITLKIEGVGTNKGVQKGRLFWWKLKLQQLMSDLKKTFFFKVPEYKPEINIMVDEVDAKAIYRALPVCPQICIRL